MTTTSTHGPLISTQDRERLVDRIAQARSSWLTYAPSLDWFRAGVEDARAVPPRDVPPNVITMNSRFTVLDLRSGETSDSTLVYPEDEAVEKGNLCVLSSMGMALLGARVGDRALERDRRPAGGGGRAAAVPSPRPPATATSDTPCPEAFGRSNGAENED